MEYRGRRTRGAPCQHHLFGAVKTVPLREHVDCLLQNVDACKIKSVDMRVSRVEETVAVVHEDSVGARVVGLLGQLGHEAFLGENARDAARRSQVGFCALVALLERRTEPAAFEEDEPVPGHRRVSRWRVPVRSRRAVKTHRFSSLRIELRKRVEHVVQRHDLAVTCREHKAGVQDECSRQERTPEGGHGEGRGGYVPPRTGGGRRRGGEATSLLKSLEVTRNRACGAARSSPSSPPSVLA